MCPDFHQTYVPGFSSNICAWIFIKHKVFIKQICMGYHQTHVPGFSSNICAWIFIKHKCMGFHQTSMYGLSSNTCAWIFIKHMWMVFHQTTVCRFLSSINVWVIIKYMCLDFHQTSNNEGLNCMYEGKLKILLVVKFMWWHYTDWWLLFWTIQSKYLKIMEVVSRLQGGLCWRKDYSVTFLVSTKVPNVPCS